MLQDLNSSLNNLYTAQRMIIPHHYNLIYPVAKIRTIGFYIFDLPLIKAYWLFYLHRDIE